MGVLGCLARVLLTALNLLRYARAAIVLSPVRLPPHHMLWHVRVLASLAPYVRVTRRRRLLCERERDIESERENEVSI